MQVFICVRTQKIAFNAHTRIYANSIELSSRQICYASKQNAKYVAKFRVWSIMPKANSDLLYSRYCPFHCTVGKDTVIIFNNLLLSRFFLFIFTALSFKTTSIILVILRKTIIFAHSDAGSTASGVSFYRSYKIIFVGRNQMRQRSFFDFRLNFRYAKIRFILLICNILHV